ncbi:MAG: hypothetical protein AB8G26_12680 [Ilumatobacter sp.]
MPPIAPASNGYPMLDGETRRDAPTSPPLLTTDVVVRGLLSTPRSCSSRLSCSGIADLAVGRMDRLPGRSRFTATTFDAVRRRSIERRNRGGI